MLSSRSIDLTFQDAVGDSGNQSSPSKLSRLRTTFRRNGSSCVFIPVSTFTDFFQATRDENSLFPLQTVGTQLTWAPAWHPSTNGLGVSSAWAVPSERGASASLERKLPDSFSCFLLEILKISGALHFCKPIMGCVEICQCSHQDLERS